MIEVMTSFPRSINTTEGNSQLGTKSVLIGHSWNCARAQVILLLKYVAGDKTNGS